MKNVALVLAVVAFVVAGEAPAPAQAPPSKVYWMAAFTVPIGKQADFHAFAEKELVPVLEKHGYRFVAVWQSIVGDIEEAIFVSEFESMAAYHKARVGLLGSEEWRRIAAKFDAFARSATTRFLSAAPYSRMK